MRRVILVVDDDPVLAESHARMLSDLGHQPVLECDPLCVEDRLSARPEIEMVLLDLLMPSLSGSELLHRIRRRWPHVGVCIATVVNEAEMAVEAIKSGAYNYVVKPLSRERLDVVLRSWFSNRPARLVTDPRFAAVVTASKCMEEVFELVRAFADGDVTTLVEGETGTGKELIAGLCHALSKRSSRSFIALNVAAISPSLFEAEMFGNRRGAFTGAGDDHAGYLEVAGDGTLFLDEIGVLAAEQQAKLLRVLETRRFVRVGETAERPFAARVVLATNRDLRLESQPGRFRADLFYRLSGHSIRLPTLREREGDITLLAHYFLRKYSSQFSRPVDGFEPETLALLERHDYPGNVRELETLISTAVLIERSRLLTPPSLPPHVRLPQNAADDERRSVQRRTILDALAGCEGNQTLAAKKLGISRSHLNRLLRRYREQGLSGRSGD